MRIKYSLIKTHMMYFWFKVCVKSMSRSLKVTIRNKNRPVASLCLQGASCMDVPTSRGGVGPRLRDVVAPPVRGFRASLQSSPVKQRGTRLRWGYKWLAPKARRSKRWRRWVWWGLGRDVPSPADYGIWGERREHIFGLQNTSGRYKNAIFLPSAMRKINIFVWCLWFICV